MKLATYKDGSRDGQLVVVSTDLTQAHHASGIVTRMQQLLDDWNFLAPQLEDLACTLTLGKARHAFPFDPRLCMAPLPRAYRLVDAQPPTHEASFGADLAGDVMTGAHEPWSAGEDTEEVVEVGAQPVVALGDVARGTGNEAAREGVRLVMLGNQWRRRAGSALVQASMAWAPVAVTPDELGRAWHRGRLALTIHMALGGQALPPVETAKAGVPDAGALIARLAQHRGVSAGTLLTLPGLPRVVLAGGDAGEASVAIEAFDAQGQSVFGAIDQVVRRSFAAQALPLERQ